jgi:ectoine hydroxylase-related dioxygenase (phytanoyl-CoA dioxygenase family)
MAAATATAPSFLHAGWAEEYWDKGYTILRGVFAAKEIAELREAFDRTYAEGMRHHATWRHQNRVMWVHQHEKIGRFLSGCQWQSWADPVLDRVRTDPRMLAICEPLIGNDLKQIINQMHWKIPDTGYTWGLHQDVRSRKPDHCFRELGRSYVQTGLAIDRHWAGNGAMKIMPCSHRRGDLGMDNGKSHHTDTREHAVAGAGFDPAKLIDVEMEPGDVALWTPYTIHGGGINTTADSQRRLYINGYVTASNCDRGQPVFHHGKPVPLTIPAHIQYDDLYVRPEPHYATDKATLVQRD